MSVLRLAQPLRPAQSRRSFEFRVPGLIIDRLSILALKIYHTVKKRNALMRRPAMPDAIAIDSPFSSSSAPTCPAVSMRFVARNLCRNAFIQFIYRQLKMYNDPTLNPAIYRKTPAGVSINPLIGGSVFFCTGDYLLTYYGVMRIKGPEQRYSRARALSRNPSGSTKRSSRRTPGKTMMQEARSGTQPQENSARGRQSPTATRPQAVDPPTSSTIGRNWCSKESTRRPAAAQLHPVAPAEVRERCKMYIVTCQRQLESALPPPLQRRAASTMIMPSPS